MENEKTLSSCFIPEVIIAPRRSSQNIALKNADSSIVKYLEDSRLVDITRRNETDTKASLSTILELLKAHNIVPEKLTIYWDEDREDHYNYEDIKGQVVAEEPNVTTACSYHHERQDGLKSKALSTNDLTESLNQLESKPEELYCFEQQCYLEKNLKKSLEFLFSEVKATFSKNNQANPINLYVSFLHPNPYLTKSVSVCKYIANLCDHLNQLGIIIVNNNQEILSISKDFRKYIDASNYILLIHDKDLSNINESNNSILFGELDAIQTKYKSYAEKDKPIISVSINGDRARFSPQLSELISKSFDWSKSSHLDNLKGLVEFFYKNRMSTEEILNYNKIWGKFCLKYPFLDLLSKKKLKELSGLEASHDHVYQYPTNHAALLKVTNFTTQENKNFIERTKIFPYINAAFTVGSNKFYSLIIHGKSGIGKTSLMIEFAHRNKEQYDVLYWFHAENSTQISIEIKKISENIGINTIGASRNLLIEQVLDVLCGSYRKVLMIFDNVKSYEISVKPFMDFIEKKVKNCNCKFHVLMTMQKEAFQDDKTLPSAMTQIELNEFDEKDVSDYFSQPTQGRSSDTVLRKIIEKIAYHPLNISIVHSYMENIKRPIEECLDLLNRISIGTPGHTATVCRMVTNYLLKLPEGNEIADVLMTIVYLNPDYISLDCLNSWFFRQSGSNRNIHMFNKIISLLLNFNLMSKNVLNVNLYKMHRLIQAAIADSLFINAGKRRERLLEILIFLQNNKFPDENIIFSIETVVTQAKEIGISDSSLGELSFRLGKYWYNDGDLFTAESYIKFADNDTFPERKNYLGKISFHRGEYEKARSQFDLSLELSKNIQNNVVQFENEIVCLLWLGNCNYELGKYTQAEEQQIKALEKFESYSKQYDLSNDLQSQLRTALANTLLAQGATDGALFNYRLALSLKIAFLGQKHHRELAINYSGLGRAYYENDEFELAKKYNKFALDLLDAYYNKAHYDIPTVLTRLARICYASRDLSELKEYADRAISLYEAYDKDDNKWSISIYVILADYYEQSFNFEESLKCLNKAIKIGEGIDLPAIMARKIKLDLEWTHEHNRCNVKEKIEYYKQTILLKTQLYGKLHTQVALQHFLLGVQYGLDGSHDEATLCHLQAYKICIVHLNLDHKNFSFIAGAIHVPLTIGKEILEFNVEYYNVFKFLRSLIKNELITYEEAFSLIEPHHINSVIFSSVYDASKLELLGESEVCTPGVAQGKIATTTEAAEKYIKNKQKFVLVVEETCSDYIKLIEKSEAVITQRGGAASHGAIITLQKRKPSVIGVTIDGLTPGMDVTVDGTLGKIYKGICNTIKPPDETESNFQFFLNKAKDLSVNGFRRINIRAMADNVRDIGRACAEGANGVGVCRTEHMFFDPEVLPIMQALLIGFDKFEEFNKLEALDKLSTHQTDEFYKIFHQLSGKPIRIRLLDAPLHEFKPGTLEAKTSLMNHYKVTENKLNFLLSQFDEVNPGLGSKRAIRLAVNRPEIYEMQAKAIFCAVKKYKNDICKFSGNEQLSFVDLGIFFPLISIPEEVTWCKINILRILQEVIPDHKEIIKFQIGVMIETPAACINSKEIAKEVDFFSCGVNDLTQLTMGFSRDDSHAMLPAYLKHKLLTDDPFQKLRPEVADMIKMANMKGKQGNHKLEVSVCGEQTSTYEALKLCYVAGVDSISVSTPLIPHAFFSVTKAMFWYKNINREEENQYGKEIAEEIRETKKLI